jgi:hypothetical protein
MYKEATKSAMEILKHPFFLLQNFTLFAKIWKFSVANSIKF